MKKLLFLFLLFPLAVISQNKITIKSSLVSISSLAPIADSTVVANPLSTSATPRAVPLGYGLRFFGGKLQQDTTIKDTIFAINGLSISGSDFRNIGLGGFLNQNTTISGSNLYAFTLDSMQAATGRGFRVNFGSDAGWDMIVRDSATGFWTRIPKGTVGQSLTMLGSGGIGWGAGGGGGSGTTIQQTSTYSGSTSFTFTSVPTGFEDYMIFLNGILLIPTTDYTTSGNVVTIPTVTTGDKVIYRRIK